VVNELDMRKYRVPLSLQIVLALAVGFGGTLGVATNQSAVSYAIAAVPSLVSGQPSPSCVIKGNISMSGERIYHVPGQRYYDETRIKPAYGERWFCSEEEARAAGWRKSKV
jgi:hypothetical protein